MGGTGSGRQPMCGIPDGQRDLYGNLVQKVDNKRKSTSSSKRVASTSRAAAAFVVPSMHVAGNKFVPFSERAHRRLFQTSKTNADSCER
jgi:hypothetical protein